jgi:putative acetyltransferase
MKIRRYQARDAKSLATLYVRSVEQIGARHYSPRQVEAWASGGPSPERVHEQAADGRTTLVAVDGSDRPIAFGDLEKDGHIDFLYCAPEAAGAGVASTLCDELEKIARASGVSRLYTEASEAARPLFLRKGFMVTSKRELEISGVPIHNYAMEKRLE